jgi:hypothetical protein
MKKLQLEEDYEQRIVGQYSDKQEASVDESELYWKGMVTEIIMCH